MAKIISLRQEQKRSSKARAQNIVAELGKSFATPMAEVNRVIAERVQAQTASVPEISHYVIDAGGKRLRPLMVLASAKLCGTMGATHIKLAAAVELMHTATLLHDDVVDDSAQRRGRPTARIRWDNPSSVLVGDFLLGQAFKLMVESKHLEVLHRLAHAAAVIAEGEVMQLNAMQQHNLNEESYINVINAKTAELFAAAAQIAGLMLPKSARNIERNISDNLASYGRNVGLAFQLADDALDYSPNARLGKNWGDDFREGKITLPVILAYQRGNQKERKFWDTMLAKPSAQKQHLEQALDYITKREVLEAVRQRAAHYAQIARDALLVFPDTKIRTQLLALAEFAFMRQH